MRAAEFKRSVRMRRAELPGWALDAAIRTFIADGRQAAEDVRPCGDLAERFAVSHDNAARLPASGGLVLSSDQAADAIASDVERVRLEVFGSTKPPHSSLAAAARWIEREAARRPSVTEAARSAASELQREAARLLAESARLVHEWPDGAGRRVVTLPYIKPGSDAVERVATWPGSSLARIAENAQGLADGTGFAPAAVVAYVLVGIRPLLPIARLTTHTRSTRGLGVLRWVTIELHSGAIAPRQFLALYDHARQELGVPAYSKPLTSQHQALMETVKRLGGEPESGAGRAAFWKRVCSVLNQEHGTRYRTWRGPEMRYRRLTRRLSGGA